MVTSLTKFDLRTLATSRTEFCHRTPATIRTEFCHRTPATNRSEFCYRTLANRSPPVIRRRTGLLSRFPTRTSPSSRTFTTRTFTTRTFTTRTSSTRTLIRTIRFNRPPTKTLLINKQCISISTMVHTLRPTRRLSRTIRKTNQFTRPHLPDHSTILWQTIPTKRYAFYAFCPYLDDEHSLTS